MHRSTSATNATRQVLQQAPALVRCTHTQAPTQRNTPCVTQRVRSQQADDNRQGQNRTHVQEQGCRSAHLRQNSSFEAGCTGTTRAWRETPASCVLRISAPRASTTARPLPSARPSRAARAGAGSMARYQRKAERGRVEGRREGREHRQHRRDCTHMRAQTGLHTHMRAQTGLLLARLAQHLILLVFKLVAPPQDRQLVPFLPRESVCVARLCAARSAMRAGSGTPNRSAAASGRGCGGAGADTWCAGTTSAGSRSLQLIACPAEADCMSIAAAHCMSMVALHTGWQE